MGAGGDVVPVGYFRVGGGQVDGEEWARENANGKGRTGGSR